MSSPMRHLRLAGRPRPIQEAALVEIVRASPGLMAALEAGRTLGAPQWRLVSGAIYNQVWNGLTGRADLHGVKDIDVFYFDPDTSYEAEDAWIRRAAAVFPQAPPVELRNQARVHLWYATRFGRPYPPLQSVEAGIDRFSACAHAVGLRLEVDGRLDLYAPFGLDDIFAFRLRPNPAVDSRETYLEKAERQRRIWPELTVEPWPATDDAGRAAGTGRL